jgi:hypothetical protein
MFFYFFSVAILAQVSTLVGLGQLVGIWLRFTLQSSSSLSLLRFCALPFVPFRLHYVYTTTHPFLQCHGNMSEDMESMACSRRVVVSVLLQHLPRAAPHLPRLPSHRFAQSAK